MNDESSHLLLSRCQGRNTADPGAVIDGGCEAHDASLHPPAGEVVYPAVRRVRHTRAVGFAEFVSSRLSPVEREALSDAVEQMKRFPAG